MRLPNWQDPKPLPPKTVPHILLYLSEIDADIGRVAPGKYSGLNHVWLAWNGSAYVAVQPIRWMDLSKIGKDQ